MNIQRLLTIIKKEFIHIKRDKPSLVIAIMTPIVFIILFGYAVNTDVENIDMAVFDNDKTLESREFVTKLKNSNYFNPNIYVDNINELEKLIDKEEVKSAIVIPSGFSKDLKRNKNPKVQLIIDGTDPTIARTALQSGVLISNMYSINIQENIMKKSGKILKQFPKIDMKTRVWYNPNLESSKFIIPGLIGLIMQNITVMLTAFSLVREKERGTLELLIVTPIKSAELIIGKMVPYILIGSIDFIIALLFGTIWFDVPIKGNIYLLIFLGIGFVMCSLAIGMFISTVSVNQAHAMQLTILFILPSVLLSGFIFPREAMPNIIQIAGYTVPLTYFLKILRGIILKGIGIEYLLKEVIILLIFGTILLIISSIRFKKKLD
ncbi:ABC transporter permease [Tepidibacter formicigenes]|uniref:ABC-2 type transport system permease protein n=1 Tax=Tepidibacter formicigenes DSM 15518 TaxID=1123349 RepID=A0A1M6R8A7_9FIRM|nr:ABC transporter permease [Tepidibacter formicigenes]SHK28715.1 ABC-2 type transport system permease protein [Tepidibacter formicigenes DSM 15518]